MRARLGLALFGLVVPLLACQPRYDGMEIRLLTGDAEVSPERIEMTEGFAIAVEIRPISSNPYEDYEVFNRIDLESINQTVLLAAPADEINRFVLVGTGVGTTAVDVLVDGRMQDHLSARVVAQEVSP